MPSLLEVLQDPNYTGANQATKEAIFNKYAPQDPLYADANPATQEAIRSKYGFGVVKKEEESPPAQVEGGAFSRGIQAYIPQTQELYNAAKVVLGSGAQKLFGKGEYTDEMIAKGLKGMEEANRKEKALTKEGDSFEEAYKKGLGTVLTEYLPYMAGQGVGNVAESLVTSLAGAAIGSAAGGVGAVPGAAAGLLEKGTVKASIKEAAKAIAEKQGEELAQKHVEEAVKKQIIKNGMTSGIVADALFHGIGEPGSRAIDELQKQGKDMSNLDFNKLVPAIAIHAGADFVAEKIGLGSLNALDAAGKNLVYDVAKNVISTGFEELPAELVQQAAERYGADLNLLDKDAMKEYLETAVGSFIQPVIPAGFGGVRGHYGAKSKRDKVKRQTESQTDKATKESADIVKYELNSRGVEVTDPELVSIIDNIMKNPPKKEEKNVSGEPNRVDTGTNQPSVPIPEEQAGQGTTTGVGETTTTNMGGAGQTVTGVGDRKTNEPSALEEADKKRQEQINIVEGYAQGNFAQAIDQMHEYESPEQAFDSALTNLIDTLNEQGIKDPAIADAAINKFNQLVREYEGKTGQEKQEQQEADRLKEIENHRNELENAWQTYNAPEQMPVGNVTEAKTTEKTEPATKIVTPEKTEEQLQAEEDAREEEFRSKAEADIDQQDVGQALARIENGDFEEKKQLRAFVNKLEKNGTIEDASDIREALSDREQDVYDVLDLIREQLEEARDNAIDEHIDEQRNEYDLSQEEQADLQAELNQELGQEAPAKEEPKREMSEDEKNLRHISNTPDLNSLPQELQNDSAVQKYHEAFNAWVSARQENMDPAFIDEIRKEVAQARQALPQEHPAFYKAPVVETKKKSKPSKEDAAKAKALRDIQAQIKELQKQLAQMPEDGQVRIRESIAELNKQAQKLMPKDSDLRTLGVSESVKGNIHPTVYDAIQMNDIKGVLTALYNTSRDYTRSLAERLLELNLNTEIFFNRQNELLREFVRPVNEQLDRLERYLNSTYPAAMIYVDQDLMASPILGTAKGYKFLRDQKGISFAGIEQDLNDVIRVYEKAASAYGAAGFYIGNNINSISLNTNIAYHPGTTTNHVLLHEIIHAATQWAINNRDKLSRAQLYALDDLTALFNYAKEHSKDRSDYAFTNLDEFVAEAFTNKKFQDFLQSLRYEMEGPKTVWSRFMQLVGRLFGTKNVLFHTLANTEVLFSARTNNAGAGLTVSPMGRPKKNAPKAPKPIATTKVNTKENFGNAIINDAVKSRMTWKNLNKENLITWLSSLKDQYRKYLLGAFTLDQLTDMVGEAIPYFKKYRNEVDAMLNTRNQILGESDVTISSWSHLQEKDPAKAKQLDTAMIEATFAKVDPDPQGKGHNAKELKNTKAGKQAQAAWDAMVAGPNGAEAVKIYREVRAFYEKRMDEYIRIQLSRLALSMKGKDLTNDEIKKGIEERYKELSADIIKPYFPIKRFGEYWLQVGKGTNKIFMQFEDAASRNMAIKDEINRLVKEKMAANSSITKEQATEDAKDELSAGNSFSTQFNAKLADAQHLDRIHELINQTAADIQAGVQLDKTESLRKSLIDGFDQWYLEMMPSQSIRKMFIHRKNVPGLSGDMLRAFAESRQRIAYQRSRFEHLPQLFQNIDLANDSLKFMPLEEATKWRDYVRELELNLKTAILEPPKQSKITTYATQAGFLYYLTSPASAIVNMMAVPGIYTPAAASKYGMGNTVKSLAKYNRMLGGTGVVNKKTGRLEFLSLARADLKDLNFTGTKEEGVELPTDKTLADVYDAGIRLGVIDTTLAHESAALAEISSNKYTGRWQKVMYYASLPFHAAEKYNRETTFMATFDMAYRKYIEKGYTKEKAYEAALQDSRNLVQDTMFNYNTINKPRYFRGDTRNIILQFKQYPQHMTVLLYRTFEKAWRSDIDAEVERARVQIKNAPEEEQKAKLDALRADLEEQRKESRHQFMGMMATTFVTAGMSGLPMFFIFEGVAKAMHAIFGDDDDLDVDNWFKNWCNDTFGGFAGHTINRGFLTAATGINFADRMSINLNDMWFPDVKQSTDEVTYVENMMISLLGPTASAILKFPDAWKKYNSGNTERAVETLVPSAIKNVMAGTRYLVEGEAKTLTGATLVDQVNPAQALTQMLGFTPEEIALAQKKAFGEKNAAVKIEAAKTNIINGFFIAIDKGDTDMLTKALEKVHKFNKLYPTDPIETDSLVNSVRKHYEDRVKANLHGGVNISKKLYPILDQIYR